MTGDAGGVPAGPPVIVLDGIDVTSLDHLLPKSSRAFARVDPDVIPRESLPNFGNHRRSMALASWTIDLHIVNLNPVILWENNAPANRCFGHIVPCIPIHGNRFESWNAIDGVVLLADFLNIHFSNYLCHISYLLFYFHFPFHFVLC